jgi:chromosome partitioning protein
MLVIVGFVSQKGGVGKSTLARALATSAAAAGTKITIADLDIQQETVKRWADRREEYEAGSEVVVAGYDTAKMLFTIPSNFNEQHPTRLIVGLRM